jgi:uncharacterized protein YaaN involved in tellurite resistance
MTTPTPADLIFPVQPTTALAVPPEPPVVGVMAKLTQENVVNPDQLVCQRLLAPATLERARTEAAEMLADVLGDGSGLANTGILTEFGNDALEDMNRLSDEVLAAVEPKRYAEVVVLVKELNRRMRSIGDDYSPQDPKVRKKYEEWKGGIARFWGKGKTLIELLMEDFRSIEGQIDSAVGQVKDQQKLLLRNIGFYDEMYRKNEIEIDKVTYKTAVMEIARDMAAQRAASIEVGATAQGDRGEEMRGAIFDVVRSLDIRITEFKARLWQGWQMSPDIRAMRSTNVDVTQKLSVLISSAIPSMKNTLARWVMMLDTKAAAEVTQAVGDMYNYWAQQYAKAGTEGYSFAQMVAQNPLLLVETVQLMTQSVVDKGNILIEAMETAQQQRQMLDQHIMAGRRAIDETTRRVNEAALAHAQDVAEKAPIQVIKSVRGDDAQS